MQETSRTKRIELAALPFFHWLIGIWCFVLAILPYDVYWLLGESPWWSPVLAFGVSGILVLLLALFGGLLSLSQETSPLLFPFFPLVFSCLAPFASFVTCFPDPSADFELIWVMKVLSLIISIIFGVSTISFISRDMPAHVAFLLGHRTPKKGFFKRLFDDFLAMFDFRRDPSRLLWIMGFILLVTLICYDDRLARIPSLAIIPAGYLAALLCVRYVKGRRGYFLSSFLWVHLLLAFFLFLGWGLGVWLSSLSFDLAFIAYISGYLLLWSYDIGDRRLKEIMDEPAPPAGLPRDLSEDCQEGMGLGSRR